MTAAAEAVVPGPFETGNPFASSEVFKEAARGATKNVVEEAGNLLGAAFAVRKQAWQAQRSGNTGWLLRLRGYAMELSKIAIDFVKQAVVIAVAKFVLELCALVINSIMDAVTKGGKGKIDISTPNVHYMADGVKPATATTTQNGYQNPFASSFQGQTVSPW